MLSEWRQKLGYQEPTENHRYFVSAAMNRPRRRYHLTKGWRDNGVRVHALAVCGAEMNSGSLLFSRKPLDRPGNLYFHDYSKTTPCPRCFPGREVA